MSRPRVLTPDEIEHMKTLILKLRQRGIAILLIEHVLPLLMSRLRSPGRPRPGPGHRGGSSDPGGRRSESGRGLSGTSEMTEPLLLMSAASTAATSRFQIFRKIDLQVTRGASIGLFGPNGHGKTTFLRTAQRHHRPVERRHFLRRRPAQPPRSARQPSLAELQLRRGDAPAHGSEIGRARRSDPRAAEQSPVPDMTVDETLSIAPYAAAGRVSADEARDQVFKLFPRVRERLSSKIRFLSGGERQMVAIGVGLMGAPKLLMLDEPTLGLSPRLRGRTSGRDRGDPQSGRSADRRRSGHRIPGGADRHALPLRPWPHFTAHR